MMTGISPADRHHCASLVLVPGSVFAVTYRFARPDIRDDLLVLRALSKELSSIPYSVSDPAIAITKIARWRQELMPEPACASQHPVVRALHQQGLLERIDAEV